jgi:hypothetical protein
MTLMLRGSYIYEKVPVTGFFQAYCFASISINRPLSTSGLRGDLPLDFLKGTKK